jgi:hypothetical protein
MTWRRLWTLRQGASEFGSRGVGKDEGDSRPIPRLLCLGGERRGEESARQGHEERPPVHHSIT